MKISKITKFLPVALALSLSIGSVYAANDVIANDDSLGEGFCIGHSYFCTKATINDEWMKSVVEYELIPLLKEYWFDEAAKVKDWSRTLREVVK